MGSFLGLGPNLFYFIIPFPELLKKKRNVVKAALEDEPEKVSSHGSIWPDRALRLTVELVNVIADM